MSLDFTTPGGLRMLLTELHYAEPGAWRHDPDAAALMEYATEKYGSLATKHGLEPDDAAYAAFNVLRTDAVRHAHDPWAATTRAVQVALIYDERANGLLCSTHQARRAEISAHHDAERFGDHETSLLDYHPAFRVPADLDHIDEDVEERTTTSVHDAFEMTVDLFTALGWPEHAIRHAITYISSRLMESGNRATTHEGLRKDKLALRALDLTQSSWSTLLTTVLGNPGPDYEHTRHGHGVWYRFLLGETPTDLIGEDELVRAVSTTAPTVDPQARLEKVLADVS
ncbi:serine/arginine repetitive matrix protein 2 [Nocardioides sp. YJ-D4]